ncbi:MFS transporter [uncultured Limosilactobacillus sp.]|uniref:MDR family MFS transporter n=1 Tax=uncultured Limosilactobacillus sp. TaxID=2837629 RepID=UPI0025FEC8F3|nr:MFS transporter [uncultured Limosilactobacillus sp.]
MQVKRLQLKWVVAASLFNNTGAALLWPLTTVYMHEYLGESMTIAGVVMFVMSLCMMLGNYLGGRLYDRWNPYLAAVLPVICATVSACMLIFLHNWPFFAVWLCLISFADGSSITVINSYGTKIEGKSTRYVFNMLYMAMNIGVVIGTLLVGVLLPISPVLVFVTTAVFYAIFLLITIRFFNVPLQMSVHHRQLVPNKHHDQFGVHVVYAICTCLMTVYLSYVLWETVMSVRITNMHIPFFAYSLLWTINGGVIIIGQPIVNQLARYIKVRTQIIWGIAIFASSFILLIFARSFMMFVVDFLILTIGEMTGIPAVPAYIDQLTDPSETGYYQGLPNIAMSIGRAIGPLYGGLIIDHFNYEVLFITVSLMMLITLANVVFLTRSK